MPNFHLDQLSVQPFGLSARTSQTDMTDRTGQRTDSIGRTVLQTVAQRTVDNVKNILVISVEAQVGLVSAGEAVIFGICMEYFTN